MAAVVVGSSRIVVVDSSSLLLRLPLLKRDKIKGTVLPRLGKKMAVLMEKRAKARISVRISVGDYQRQGLLVSFIAE